MSLAPWREPLEVDVEDQRGRGRIDCSLLAGSKVAAAVLAAAGCAAAATGIVSPSEPGRSRLPDDVPWRLQVFVASTFTRR